VKTTKKSASTRINASRGQGQGAREKGKRKLISDEN
jgi:hypothetical protein